MMTDRNELTGTAIVLGIILAAAQVWFDGFKHETDDRVKTFVFGITLIPVF